jgi:nucleoside-diphosphate-sugar epimerase
VSKEQFISRVAEAMGVPAPTRRPPLWLARIVTWCCEGWAKMRGWKEAPRFNFTSLKFLGLNLDFSIAKARRELGYHPRVPFSDAIAETMAWYK